MQYLVHLDLLSIIIQDTAVRSFAYIWHSRVSRNVTFDSNLSLRSKHQDIIRDSSRQKNYQWRFLSYQYFRPSILLILSLAYLSLCLEILNQWKLDPIDLTNRLIYQIEILFLFKIHQFTYLSEQFKLANSFSKFVGFQYPFEALKFNQLMI